MVNSELANFYTRDIQKLIEEINLFKNEENLWITKGTVKNSAGNLILHLIGGMNYLIGATLAHTGYVRNRDEEFKIKNVERKVLTAELEKLEKIISKTINNLSTEQMQAAYPIFFDKPNVQVDYVLTQLLLHLNYHLGQVNYLRRIVE